MKVTNAHILAARLVIRFHVRSGRDVTDAYWAIAGAQKGTMPASLDDIDAARERIRLALLTGEAIPEAVWAVAGGNERPGPSHQRENRVV